ncbi:hypothetical protein G4B88_016249 [Cannabis sativa]|uniref:WAT1-related protein n=1 Tax=Cannabis sativa TaxID=3483 RepID=A0A7J6FNA0_CANSA|nr:hypothetical protein G4B88_016249 [Cannabis sativa]
MKSGSSLIIGHPIMASLETQKPYIAMIFVQVVYAGMALFSKAAIAQGMNPFVFVVYLTPLSWGLVCKIFFISLMGITLSLNLYYVAINFTSATFAAATTNAIPAITFVMAVLLRIESVCIKNVDGVAKVMGSIVSLSGALVYAFVKGPQLKLMMKNNWYNDHDQKPINYHRHEWVKGSLMMLSANTAWSLWLILQPLQWTETHHHGNLAGTLIFFLLLIGIVVTGITYWIQVWAIEKKGPVFTSLFTPLALIITAIISAFIWKETFYWGSVGGAILLVGGLYSVLWGKKKEDNTNNNNNGECDNSKRRSETNAAQRQESKEEILSNV